MMDIDAQTKFCGVIGNPVGHSLSPAIHNAAFRTLGLNFVYLAWQVEAIGDAVKGLRALGNFRGASVTIPHKVAVIPFLDQVETTAQRIGAINTIVAGKGTLTGYNTDATGARMALKAGGVALTGRHIVILGSGGAARAIAFALAAESGVEKLTLLGIEDAERIRLAQDIRSTATVTVEDSYLDESALRRVLPAAQILIHCTPVGMSPKAEATCVPGSLLHPDLAVMDIVYNPRETRLLREAGLAGCKTISGLDMFLNQAVAQFELWTDQPAPVEVMRRVLESHFR
ncbi:shikimate dehydrogenase [Candidatus Nitrospira nitrificans]|uniref:Shikimate dehydrogenase (NADP(+)) n=1 Tax=Candidatus Nitrospira nitrificans TaxID=1742973 RepID=A0A0S4LFK2_9BACT|nr:shikimate dehydrogenase [Candidatus Nitrospira nitrificans]CUS35678.1 Shikimate dehydrogenase [Candidatus Nitrospira nitrificans]